MKAYQPHSVSSADQEQRNRIASSTHTPAPSSTELIQRMVAAPETMQAGDLLHLQGQFGNRTVQRMMQHTSSQPPIQRVIHNDKNVVVKRLGLTKFYKELANDDERAWALQLHRDANTVYTFTTAKQEIESLIKQGKKAPELKKTSKAQEEKKKRMKRVREWENQNAPDESSTDYKDGAILGRGSKIAFNRMKRKMTKKPEYLKGVNSIRSAKPGLFNDQDELLSGENPFLQIGALIEANPQSHDIDLGGTKVQFDAIDVKKNEEREKKRQKKDVNLNQLFVQQDDNHNSYWSMADSTQPLVSTTPHKQLRALEMFRLPEASFNIASKEILHDDDKLSNKEAFGDETKYVFSESKGALKPSRARRRLQTASSSHVLKKLNEKPKDKIGTHPTRPVTTGSSIQDALDEFKKEKTQKKKKAALKRLTKEEFRVLRAQNQMDVESDTDSEDEFEYDDLKL